MLNHSLTSKNIKKQLHVKSGSYSHRTYFSYSQKGYTFIVFNISISLFLSLKVADMTGDMKQLEHGRTNIHSAITLTQTELLLPAMGNRPLIPTVIVIFSDGQFNADLDDELHEQFESLMEENTVIAIGLSRSANRENLRYISHHYMARYKYDSEVEFLQEVHEKICPSG